MKKPAIFALLFIFLTAAAWGETYTWAGGSSGDWNDEDNWEDSTSNTGNGFPGETAAGDDVIINIDDTINITGALPYDLAGLTIDTGANLILDAGGYQLTITGMTTLNGNLTFTGASITFGAIDGDGGSSLTINGNAVFNGDVAGVTNLHVSGAGNTVTINADITTTGTQSYGGNVTLGGTHTLTSSGGSVSVSGAVSGTDITVNASHGILMDAANTLSGDVALNNTHGTANGNISFHNTSASVNLTAENNSATGTITVNQTGALSVTSASAPGSISLTATGSITQTGAITTGGAATLTATAGGIAINGTIHSSTLALNAAGTVNIGNAITVTGGNNTAHNANAGVHITANELTGNGDIHFNGNTGWACVHIESLVSYTGIVSGNGIHYHADRHIVYRPGADLYNYTNVGGAGDAVVPGSYLYIQSNAISGDNLGFFAEGSGNIYIIDVGNAGTREVNFSTVNGYIEIRGAYTSTGGLNLNPGGAGTVRLVNSESNNSNHAALNLPSFNISGKTLDLRGTTASIETAGNIQIGTVTSRDNDGTNNLTLDSGSNINIGGAVGVSTANRVGDITVVKGNVTFNGVVYANSYIQNAGNAAISATQNYLETFTFLGTALTINGASIITNTGTGAITVNGSMNASGNVTLNTSASNGAITLPVVTGSAHLTISNGGQYTQNGAVTADSFNQTGSGNVSLAGNITVTDASMSAAVIRFNSQVVFTNNLTFSVPATGGLVDLMQGIDGNYTLTLRGGSSDSSYLELSKTSGILGDVIISAGSHVKVSSGKIINQNDGTTLTLQANSVFDTSAGTWHMGASTTSNDFAGINGTLILGAGSKLIGGNVNLAGSFTVNNADWAAIAARGDVEIGGSVNFSGVHPQLIVEMAGSGSQRLITAQRLGSFHVKSGSTTNLTHDLTVTGEVQIEYPGVLDAGSYNIVMQAGLNGTKNVGPVKVGRWIILNAPETISAGSVSVYNMNAFRQNPEGSVTFQKMSPSGDPVFFEIIGNTAWQKFICNEAGAVIQFSLHPHQHVFIDKFEIKGTGTPSGTDYSGYITLTRLPENTGWVYIYDGSPPGTDSIPNAPASRNLKAGSENEKKKFWNFNLITPGFHGQRLMDIEYVTIYFSHAWNQRIPISTEIMHLNAVPFYKYDGSVRTGYFNNDWVEVRKIIYSFAEDSNGNGKVDRIRVQTNVSLNGDFTRFNVQVEGFRVDTTTGNRNTAGGDNTPNGFDRVDEITGDAGDDSSFYIYLQEPANLYDGRIIKWWVTENTDSLMDSITQTMPVGDPVTGDPATDEYYTTINTIPPRVSYTLTLPGYNKTFVRMSQPVQRGSGANITGDSVTGYVVIERTSPYNLALEYRPFDAPVVPYNVPVPGGENSYLLTLDTSPSISDLAKFPPVGDEPAGYYFTMENDFRDLGVRALDWNDEKVDETTYMYYPSPRYPVDWNYSGYATYKGNGHIPSSYGLTDDSDPGNPNPDTGLFLPPNRVLTPQMIKDLEENNPVTPSSFGSGVVNRRVTDVLVSLAPANNDSENYFAWPVWARYHNNANPGNTLLSGDFWSQRNTDNGVIWTFDGAAFLEARGFDLQARMNSGLTGNLELFWTTDIPTEYRNPREEPVRGRSTGGLWLPYPADLHNNRPLYYFAPFYEGNAINQADASASNPPLYNYLIDGENKSGKKLEFIFRINGGSPSDLFIARLDIPRGGAIPENWYYLVRPFGFDIQDIRLQRGGVTVLNNVINSDARENAIIRYHLVRPGRVTIQVYTLDGTLVKSLMRNEYREAGEWTGAWDGTNNSGRAVVRGMYFVRVVAPDIDEIRKIMVVR
jgi:hypothetical protein